MRVHHGLFILSGDVCSLYHWARYFVYPVCKTMVSKTYLKLGKKTAFIIDYEMVENVKNHAKHI